MDKGAGQTQRNERQQRKLVRSSEHSWFGDRVSSPVPAAVHHHNEPPPTTDTAAVASSNKKSSARDKSPAADNKTIRRLEFFTSLQKQLISSITRRGSSQHDSPGIKRNASCRHKDERDKRDKAMKVPLLPSSYSSASLATVDGRSPGRGGVPPTTHHSCLSTGLIESMDQASNNQGGHMV